MRLLLPLLALLEIVACAHSAPVSELRFKNQPPVWSVDDRRPLPAAPKERDYHRTLYHIDGFFVRRATRALEMRPPRRAADVNSLDEVPDSSWFTNRIGVRDLSIPEVVRGPNRGPDPIEHRPWTILKVKAGGLSVGFVVEDARGDKYVLKFDEKLRPEMSTAAHAITLRILWACGYNVPEDYIGYVRREDLVIGAKAKAKGLTEAMLDRTLEHVYKTTDGRIRVLASRWLPGKPVGPYAREGRRADDPNDLIDHERRRSLRGQYPIFSWLDHADLQEDNTVDVFVDNHVKHYLIDFGEALGVQAHMLGWKAVGHTYRVDLSMAFSTLLSLGLWHRPWDDRTPLPLRGVGMFSVKDYNPSKWRPNSIYFPLEDKDRFDAFWGAKILMRFTRAQLAAIVAEGKLSDPRAAAHILDMLVQRQYKTARYWFDQVAPLDRFRIEGDDRLCFTDLTLSYGLRRVASRYEVDVFDGAGKPTGYRRTLPAASGGRNCAPGVAVNGYTIVRLRTYRDGHPMPPVFVHLARDPANRAAIIGLRRH